MSSPRPDPLPLGGPSTTILSTPPAPATTTPPVVLPTPPSISVRAHYPSKTDLTKITMSMSVHQPGVTHTKDFDVTKNADGSITVTGTMSAATQGVLAGLASILDHLDATGNVGDIWS